jgi:stress-induced morphogen
VIASEDIQQLIAAALPGSNVAVEDMTGGSDHFRIKVVSDEFEGKTLIQRHRMVHAPLKDVLGGALHAIVLDTKTTGE